MGSKGFELNLREGVYPDVEPKQVRAGRLVVLEPALLNNPGRARVDSGSAHDRHRRRRVRPLALANKLNVYIKP